MIADALWLHENTPNAGFVLGRILTVVNLLRTDQDLALADFVARRNGFDPRRFMLNQHMLLDEFVLCRLMHLLVAGNWFRLCLVALLSAPGIC